ncbi:MAG: hypothetical protein GY947_06145 [Rhodobacteraceae bacterium]|nr:hypothetical protein [Paracoccaceae bacterium]
MADLMSIIPIDEFNPIAGSPLSGKKPVGHPVILRQTAFEEKFIVRGNLGSKEFQKGSSELLSMALPGKVGQVSQNEHLSVTCLGPDEWLVIEAEGSKRVSSAAIGDNGPDLKLVPVSDYYCGLEVSGDHAIQVLTKVVAVDFELSNFPAKTCVQTALHNVPVIIWRQAVPLTFRIYVRWSLAEFVWDLLADLAQSEDHKTA